MFTLSTVHGRLMQLLSLGVSCCRSALHAFSAATVRISADQPAGQPVACAAQCQDEEIAFTPPKSLGMLSASMIALDAAATVVASSAIRAATTATAQKCSPGSLVSGTSAVLDAICMVLCAYLNHATCEAEHHVSLLDRSCPSCGIQADMSHSRC